MSSTALFLFYMVKTQRSWRLSKRHTARERESGRETNHGEAVADPEAAPAERTRRHVDGLTVDGDDVGLDVADDAATDERRDLVAGDRHHRQRGGRRQPERLVVATGVVADVVEVAEDERHRAEPLQARARRPCDNTHAPTSTTAHNMKSLV